MDFRLRNNGPLESLYQQLPRGAAGSVVLQALNGDYSAIVHGSFAALTLTSKPKSFEQLLRGFDKHRRSDSMAPAIVSTELLELVDDAEDVLFISMHACSSRYGQLLFRSN